jgi:hypothetical protein
MNSKFAAGALTALLYCQGLLGFAGLATVLLRDRTAETPVIQKSEVPSARIIVAGL